MKKLVVRKYPKGRRSAVVYSIVESAKAKGLNVFSYLTHLLSVLPAMMKSEKYDLSSIALERGYSRLF